jgi:methionine--tRNA ligase beta chain
MTTKPDGSRAGNPVPGSDTADIPPTPHADETKSSPPIPDLRVAKVLLARDHPNADRLLVMEVDLGSEKRQIVAGIVGHYELTELEGLSIVVVANLQHAKLRGEVSQGMLLAAENDEGRLGVLLAPDADPGTPLRAEGGPPPAAEITFQEFHENTLLASPEEVTLNGSLLTGTRLVMDRDVFGKLR